MTASRRLLDFLEPRLPALARAVATPVVRGSSSSEGEAGTVWRAAPPARALVVYLTDAPALSRWIAGSIATRLRSLVLVPNSATDATAIGRAAAATLARAGLDQTLSADAPVVIVAEGTTATPALAASRGTAARLALLYPTDVAADPGSAAGSGGRSDAASRVPTTLIQASSSATSRAAVIALERSLRAAGTAVRETEYAGVADGWARYPRASTGSRRALDDLIAFLDRGIGEASTFDVIPGWDLH